MFGWLTQFLAQPGATPESTPERDGRPRPRPRPAGARPVTKAEYRTLYDRPDSFTDLLPWVDYDPATQQFLLADGVTVGALYELTPIPCEARSQAVLEESHERLHNVIAESLPEADPPWVLQMFVEDSPSLASTTARLEAYVAEHDLAESPFSREYLALMRAHLRALSQPGGLFLDRDTERPWSGQLRRVRLALYRPAPAASLDTTSSEELDHIAARFESSLRSAQLGPRRLHASDLYEWLVPWFNPAPALADGDPNRLLELAPYPPEAEQPIGRDFAALFTFSCPESKADGSWYFDGLPHRAVTIQSLRRVPRIGHLTAERTEDQRIFAVYDLMPPGTRFSMTIVVQPQDKVANHLASLHTSRGDDTTKAGIVKNDAQRAQTLQAEGLRLFPTLMTFYLCGQSARDLRQQENELASLLANYGMQPILREADLLPLNSYITALPFGYDARADRRARRARYVWSDHLAALAPLYGRSRGTGSPGILMYNRGGEAVTFDPLAATDRRKNGHMLIVGPTGAGKSALLVYLIMQAIAIHRPRIYLIEAGNSFGLLGDYLAQQGVNVQRYSLNPGTAITLAPFAEAIHLNGATGEDADAAEDDEQRDLLGELEIIATLMITGGDRKEQDALSRADRNAIRQCIIAASEHARHEERAEVLTQDVVAALRQRAADDTIEPFRRQRCSDMADSLELFTQGFDGQVFNQPGTAWPDAEVTILDLGVYAREGYGAQLAVAYTSIMQRITALVENEQHSSRQTLVITDEAHLITTNPLLAGFLSKIVKMWRKLGTWYWPATQNMEDFPDAARRLLSIMEWWVCLVMPKSEVDELARFRGLTDEQRVLLQSARKQPPNYVEGVLLSDSHTLLFRNVPPPLCFALAGTEKHEKAQRAKIMAERNCSEVEAAIHVAEQLAEARRESAAQRLAAKRQKRRRPS